MYQLHYSPGACSMAIHVLLLEMGAKFEAVNASIKDGKTRTPEFLKINPRGQVPVLVEDGKVMLEGGAILTYLADKHKSLLLPRDGWERAQALQWLMFVNSSLHPMYSRAAWLVMRAQGDEAARKNLAEQSCDAIQTMWDQVEEHLSKQPFLAGKDCTLGDVLLTVIANWSFLPRSFTFGPNTKKLLKAVSARPAYQKALQSENVEYKAAA